MDESTKQDLLGHALARANNDGLIRLRERELLGDPRARATADDLAISREVAHPIREIDRELEVLPYDLPTRYHCGCREPPVRPVDELLAWATSKMRTTIDLAHERWSDGRGPLYDLWLGQCPECRTIYWRIQEA
jgi:hypothetical protein